MTVIESWREIAPGVWEHEPTRTKLHKLADGSWGVVKTQLEPHAWMEMKPSTLVSALESATGWKVTTKQHSVRCGEYRGEPVFDRLYSASCKAPDYESWFFIDLTEQAALRRLVGFIARDLRAGKWPPMEGQCR